MPKIICSTYVTLDGVIDNPQDWPQHRGFDELAGAIQLELLNSCDAILLGRRTYESFAAAWPTRSGDPYSDRVNAMRKYVVSSTITAPEWNNTEVITDPATEIARLKQEPGQDILQFGFGPLTALMIENGLLDELHLWLYPVLIGPGEPVDRLLQPGAAGTFDLIDTTALSNGIVLLKYRVAS